MEETGSWRKLGLVTVFLILGSSNPVAVKAAFMLGWPPLILGIMRMGFIGLFFLGWSRLAREHPLGPNQKARRYALIAAACKGLGVFFFYAALVMIPVNRAVILSTISPMVNLALVHLVLDQERIRKHHVLGIAVTFLGTLALLLIRQSGSLSPAAGSAYYLPGDMAMLASVILHQAMIVFEKQSLNNGTNPRQLIISTNMVSVSVFFIMLFFSRESFTEIPTDGASFAIYLYLISFVGVILFYYRRWLVSVFEVSYLNSFSHAGKALSIIYAALLLKENVPLESIICFGVIVTGTVIAIRPGGTGKTLGSALES